MVALSERHDRNEDGSEVLTSLDGGFSDYLSGLGVFFLILRECLQAVL